MRDKEAQLIWEAYTTVDINHSAEDINDLRNPEDKQKIKRIFNVPENIDFLILVFPYASTHPDLRKLNTGDVVSFNKCLDVSSDKVVACGDITAIVIGRNDDWTPLTYHQSEILNQLGHLPCAPDSVKCTKPNWASPQGDEPNLLFLMQLHK